MEWGSLWASSICTPVKKKMELGSLWGNLICTPVLARAPLCVHAWAEGEGEGEGEGDCVCIRARPTAMWQGSRTYAA
jgi:hypothetical protein